MKKIILKGTTTVRPDGRLIYLEPGSVVDLTQFDASIITQLETVLVNHSASLKVAVDVYLKKHPGDDDITPAVLRWFMDQPSGGAHTFQSPADGPTVIWDMSLGQSLVLETAESNIIVEVISTTEGTTGHSFFTTTNGGGTTITFGSGFIDREGNVPLFGSLNLIPGFGMHTDWYVAQGGVVVPYGSL